jgi:hypothetical protein
MRWPVLCAFSLFTLVSPSFASAQGPLERARVLYNAGEFEKAIDAAASVAKPSPSAELITARARLELFRKAGDPSGLAAVRAQLGSLNPHRLVPQELVEWQIGLGSALFLENQPGPAAETFTTVFPSARARLTPAEFDKFLEWWGAASSQAATALAGEARTRVFERLREGAAAELERNPLSRPATYWTVVAARGAGDLDGAWDAAVAGWIRAGGQQEGRQLRADLEAFVTETLIPERAQARTGQRLDGRAAVTDITALTEEWRAITTRWSGQ